MTLSLPARQPRRHDPAQAAFRSPSGVLTAPTPGVVRQLPINVDRPRRNGPTGEVPRINGVPSAQTSLIGVPLC